MLTRVIIETKRLHCSNQIKTSSNTVTTVRKIIKDTTGKTQSVNTITEINTEACQITDTKGIGNAFNNFFVQIAENLNNKHIYV
jgi:hypothetical protein